MDKGERARAIGCWYGQLAGDALGSLVEFKTAAEIAEAYPDGVRELHDGGTFDTLAGQPTDDSEMALALSWSLLDEGDFVEESVARHYVSWAATDPFDIGNTVRTATNAGLRALEHEDDVAPAMRNGANQASQANGALMRVSPIAIFGVRRGDEWVAKAAMDDASLTHPHPACRQANAVFAVTVARAIRGETDPRALYASAVDFAARMDAHPVVRGALRDAEDGPPRDFSEKLGWVRMALQNAFHVLLHAGSLEEGLVETVGRGGDSDTNAAIAGALLGAVYGASGIPAQWRACVDSCEPDEDEEGVKQPRPSWLWPTGAEGLALSLLASGQDVGAGGHAHPEGDDDPDADADDLEDALNGDDADD
jgi:ADP-ribosylglycohydrolase